MEKDLDDGLKILLNKKELLIKGTREDLLELSKYIQNIALSDNKKDHIHLDELTLLCRDMEIDSLIIEKE